MTTKKINDSVFREYDIRGIIGQEIPLEEVYNLAQAIGWYYTEHDKSIKKIAVGMDGRISSPAIKEEVVRALTDAGFDVYFLGICPTPALYFSLHTLPVDAGIMITASHNPKEYNGFKICLEKECISGTEIRKIQKNYQEGQSSIAFYPGTVIDYPIHESYIKWLISHFSHLKNLDVPLVIDCGNAVAGTIIPELVRQLGWKNVTILFQDIDGTYPHHEADPTIEKNMADVKKALATSNALFGIGFHGDADRMGAMTKNGYLIPGDTLLAILSKPIIESNPGAAVVCDVTSSSALVQTLTCWGGKCCMVPDRSCKC